MFSVNLPLKLYVAPVVNINTGSFKFLHNLLDMYLDHMLAKYEPNCMVQNVQLFELFDIN